MSDKPTAFQISRFLITLGSAYFLTIVIALYLVRPPNKALADQYINNLSVTTEIPKALPEKPIVSGKPVRIVVNEVENGLNIDLPLDDGIYDSKSGNWSLSNTHAQYALISSLANDRKGTTFVYGHNSRVVFGMLNAIHENTNTTATLYTDNGHIFRYRYVGAIDISPNDTSLFNNQSSPTLLVQTCSGNFFQFRRFYTFRFEGVE